MISNVPVKSILRIKTACEPDDFCKLSIAEIVSVVTSFSRNLKITCCFSSNNHVELGARLAVKNGALNTAQHTTRSLTIVRKQAAKVTNAIESQI
jgi:hypothetical protein